MDGTITKYVYAGDTVIAEYDGLDQLQAGYIPGLVVDRPVLMDRGGTVSYYHYDGSGSVIAMTDAFGTVAESYAYGPYGESADGDLIGNPYRFTGRRLDAETGLYYYRTRYYDPVTGRFLQADPAGFIDGLNLYAYVRNDPLNFVDPFGLEPGQSYYTPEDAAEAFVRETNPISIRDNVEYGVRIYTYIGADTGLSYTYTEPVRGEEARVKIPPPPEGAVPAGIAHTHGAYDPYFDSENLSPFDERLADKAGEPMFIGTPDNAFVTYDPITRSESYTPLGPLEPRRSSIFDSYGTYTGLYAGSRVGIYGGLFSGSGATK